MIDLEIFEQMWTPHELEQLICGQKSLDFTELKEYCMYANGF